MGRWYQSATPEFVDYSEGITSSKGGKGATTPTALSLIGELDVLPEDWGRHQEKLAEVDSRINEITARMQADPRKANRYLPDVQRLKQDILRDTSAGEWAAMKERKRLVDEHQKGLEDLRKKDPALAYMAGQAITVPELGWDAQTQTFNRPEFPLVETYSPEQTRSWENSVKTTVKDRILSKVDDVKKINPLQSIMTFGQTVGVTRDDVLEAAVGSVDPKALLAAESRRRLTERMTGEQTGIDERNFFTRDANGKIQLNLDTEWGRRVDALARGLEREDFKGQRINFTSQPELIKAKEASSKRVAAYRSSLRSPSETEWYPKLVKLFEGEGFNAPSSSPELKVDNSLAGRKIGSAGIINRIEKEPGQKPQVVYHELVDRGDGKKVVQERRQELDFDLLRNTLDAKTFKKLEQDAKQKGGWSDEGVVKLDATKDKMLKRGLGLETTKVPGVSLPVPRLKTTYTPTPEWLEQMLKAGAEEREQMLIQQMMDMEAESEEDREIFEYEE